MLRVGAPFDVSRPVIEKGWLTWAEEGAEMVRALVLRGCAATAGVALQNNNAYPQIASNTVTTITTLFSANIPSHLER